MRRDCLGQSLRSSLLLAQLILCFSHLILCSVGPAHFVSSWPISFCVLLAHLNLYFSQLILCFPQLFPPMDTFPRKMALWVSGKARPGVATADSVNSFISAPPDPSARR